MRLYNPSFCEHEGGFNASLAYVVSLRPAWDTGDCLKKQQTPWILCLPQDILPQQSMIPSHTHPIQVSILTLSPLVPNPALFFSPQLVPSTDYALLCHALLLSDLSTTGARTKVACFLCHYALAPTTVQMWTSYRYLTNICCYVEMSNTSLSSRRSMKRIRECVAMTENEVTARCCGTCS